MTKKIFPFLFLPLLTAILYGSCRGKGQAPKAQTISVTVVSADTLARLSDDIQCHVHVDFTCLRGKQYSAVNDSLLRMGLLQPDYFSVSYDQLDPTTAIPIFMRQYVKEYMEIAQLVRQKEKKASQLIGELSIKTELRAAKDDYLTALSHITINNGNGQPTRYTIVRNFNPKDGKAISLQDVFGSDYKEELTQKVTASLAERLGLDDDDITGLRAKGYFVGIDAYPTDNFILTDDSLIFIYTPGEISPQEVRVAIDN